MGKQYKIVVVDDSKSILDTVKEMLSKCHEIFYNIYTATNGREACTLIYHERPDIILIDIEMPIMSGIEAISKIRGNSLIKNTPIIVMSSSRQFQNAFAVGADDFLIKPFTEYELLLRVQLNIKLHERGNEVKKQHELLKNQKQEAINQRDIILRQKTELIDDLQYARHIQEAILPSKSVIGNLLPNYFIYNKPKNIVSGDFYWVASKDNLIIIAVGDCTGHGMSGALMTMAGIAFLDDILARSEEVVANKILNTLRTKVIQLLKQKGDIGEASSGMDIALCIYNQLSNTIQFAGANNPVYIARENGELEIIKGDRIPIGYYFDNEQPFTNVDLSIYKNDIIYLFTDGYADQFGGPNEKKFRYKQFQELIVKTALESNMNAQIELINNTMVDWIGNLEQIDDMLIMGIRF